MIGVVIESPSISPPLSFSLSLSLLINIHVCVCLSVKKRVLHVLWLKCVSSTESVPVLDRGREGERE